MHLAPFSGSFVWTTGRAKPESYELRLPENGPWESTGTSLEAMHRVTSVASGALDALPHNGAVITVLAIAKLTHSESYFDIFVTAVVIPFISLVSIIVLASAFGGF